MRRRAVTAVVLVAAGVASTAAGVAAGTLLQGRLEATPSAGDQRALDELNAPQTPRGAVDARRGPNRADLGGGR